MYVDGVLLGMEFFFLYKTVNNVGSVCLVTRLWQNLLKCGEKIESWKIGTEKGAESLDLQAGD